MISTRPLRALLQAVAIATAMAGLWAGPAAAQSRVVMELFTSQGCSNCPPADALIAEYADRADVIALSLPVDYWNYLGWADTLARHEHTERQRGYADARGDRQVYTPQMVIDGRHHVIGSDRQAVEAAIGNARGLVVPVSLALGDDAMTVSLGDAVPDAPQRATVWLVLFDSSETVAIGQGENRGQTITYRNVVMAMRRISMWKGTAMTVDLPRVEMALAGADGCAILLQSETRSGLPGAVIGAAKATYPTIAP